MKNKRILWLLTCLFLLMPHLVSAEVADAAQGSSAEMTTARYALHKDAVTGEEKLRLVIDVTGPVKVSTALDTSSDPKLTVDIQGAAIGKLTNSMSLDGRIADAVNFTAINATSSRLIINLPAVIDDDGYKVFTLKSDSKANKPNRVVIDINKPAPQPEFSFTPGLNGKVIVLDPGHGGSDPGAIGPNQISEKSVTLPVALRVKALLEKAGAKVVMTRSDDRDVFGVNASAVDELGARVNVAKNSNADVFVSIHANAFSDRSAGGTSTHYYLKSSYDKLLAQSLQNNIVSAVGLQDRGAVPANFYVVKRTTMPASLIEMAFISNPDEEKLLNSPQFQQQMAQGIVNGLNDFFTQAARQGGRR